jgi:hypothetical protein
VILLCGIPSEPPLQLVIDAAQRAGVPHLVFSQREAQFCDIALDVTNAGVDGVLRLANQDWPLSTFMGVYVRLMDHESLPEVQRHVHPDVSVERSRSLHDVLHMWFDIAPTRVVNRPSAMGSNVSKPYQAQRIAQLGFAVPPTLVTSDPDEARAFRREYGRVIFKSVSSVRSIVRELTDAELPGLSKLRYLPTQFQAFVHGPDVRVHVVGNAVFATQISSEAVDYRYAAREDLAVEMQPYELPGEVRERCIALSKALDLPFCGIDLKRAANDSYYCFEVNPSPAFSYYELRTDQPIAGAVVRYLDTGRV